MPVIIIPPHLVIPHDTLSQLIPPHVLSFDSYQVHVPEAEVKVLSIVVTRLFTFIHSATTLSVPCVRRLPDVCSVSGCIRAPCGHHLRQDVRKFGHRPQFREHQQGHEAHGEPPATEWLVPVLTPRGPPEHPCPPHSPTLNTPLPFLKFAPDNTCHALRHAQTTPTPTTRDTL